MGIEWVLSGYSVAS